MLNRLIASLAVACASAVAVVGLTSCGSSSSPAPAVNTPDRAYNGTAAVGDMLTISVDPDARTITYSNLTNGLTGTATYTIAVDGTWTITDPNAHLLRGFEIPDHALILQVNKAGQGQDQKSVVTAIQSQTIAAADLADGEWNYMQFRTNSGGMEVGWITSDSAANLSSQYYWPFGATQSTPVPYSDPNEEAMAASAFTRDPGGRFLSIAADGAGEPLSYMFRTAAGFLAIDTPNGSLVCLPQSSSTAWVPANNGGYKGFFYRKDDATTVSGNVETGTVSLSDNRIVFTAGASAGTGHVVVYDADGVTALIDVDLTDMAAGGHVDMSTKLTNSCPGLFTGTVISGTVTRQVFVTFMADAALITSYASDSTTSGFYSYLNGIALRDPAAGG